MIEELGGILLGLFLTKNLKIIVLTKYTSTQKGISTKKILFTIENLVVYSAPKVEEIIKLSIAKKIIAKRCAKKK